MNDPAPIMLTVEQVAERLSLSISHVYAHARSLGGVKIGRLWRFRSQVIESIMCGEQPVAPAPESPTRRALLARLPRTLVHRGRRLGRDL